MITLGARDLLGGRRSADRVFFHGEWFRGHNNPRYSQLLPRLERLDAFLVKISDRRLLRGVQFRALRATDGLRYAVVFGAANRRYRSLFAIDLNQIPHFNGSVVADVDDPRFTAGEAGLLNQPNVRAYVVTSGAAAKRFRELGVDKPVHVIPQGVALDSVSERDIAAVAGRHRRPGEVVVGYIAPWLRSAGDRDGSHELFGVDHLLELWEEIAGRVENARLWLIGQPSPRVRERCARRGDVLLLDRMPQGQALSYIANFDIALYPRRVDHAPMPVKLAEYMGLGVPTVSYDLELARVLTENRAGTVARSARDFVGQVERLAGDATARAELAAAAREAGKALDWRHLANRYEREVLDRHLP